MRWGVLAFLFVALAACGSGSGSDNPTGGSGGTVPPPLPPNPDLALVLVSGHQGLFDGAPSLSYLHEFLGPRMVADLENAGYTIDVSYFVDHPTATNAGGYIDLVAHLRFVRDQWVRSRTRPTRVVVVAHSHGGAWATAAIREVSDVPVRLQVALDHSSYGWGIVGHDTHDAVMGGDPRDEYRINTIVRCPSDAGSWSDTSDIYDLEDVVFPNVQEALEVQSGEPVIGIEPYDEKWNVRLDGTVSGLSCFWTGTDHDEVRRTNGTTYPQVINWIRTRLASD